MNSIPVVSSRRDLLDRLRGILDEELAEIPELIQISTQKAAIEYLNVELPELVILDCADSRTDCTGLLDTLQTDPWLHHGGIIVLSESFEQSQALEEFKGANLISILEPSEVPSYLPRILIIVDENRRILFQHEIGSDFVKNLSGAFEVRNDLLEARCYTNLICNYLHNANRIDTGRKLALALSLTEMLVNAVEHGNCGITYEEKTEFLEKGGFIEDLIEEKCRNAIVAARRVTFEYAFGDQSARFTITDRGDGFDWRQFREKKQSRAAREPLELHGRGILMTESVVGELHYNELGNQVSFEVDYQKNAERRAPGLFANIEPRSVAQGEVIFRSGEPSNYLYYIARGSFDVIVNNQAISTLTEDDIFMGEMSFLLNNKRSATVRARTEGKLIEVSKRRFVEAIRRKPHYALFLARLLAQRIQRLNETSGQIAAVMERDAARRR